MTLKLHCFGESGNSYKAALPLTLAGLDWEPIWVDFFSGAARSPEYRALNPMGEAPVLVTPEFTISQSGVIQQWIIDETGRFGGRDKAEAREVLRWQFWDNHKGSSQFGTLRFVMNFLPEQHRNPDVIAFLQGRAKAALAVLESELSKRDFLVGDGPTMADFSASAYLYYPEPFGFDRASLPAIDAWLTRLSDLPGWKHPYDRMPGSPADRA